VLVRTVRTLAEPRAQLFAAHGLRPSFKVCDCLSPYLNTVFTTAEYVGDVPLPPHTFLVGPTRIPDDDARGDEVPFPWERLPSDRPIVYASFGSQISWQPTLFRKIAEAVAPLGVTLVISAGDLALDLPDAHTIIVPYAPQLSLLGRASLLITHGGANSVMEALVAGVPFLISPVCNDQPLQARFVTQSGVGTVLDLHEASVSETRAAVTALLTPDAPQRAHVARVSASYRAHDGAHAAASRIVTLADRASPPR
jgi:MGT family glycosyltransferase